VSAHELERLEREVEQGVTQARTALLEIKRRELYRDAGHDSWERYAETRWLGRALARGVARALGRGT
jgi:hypothetical protein